MMYDMRRGQRRGCQRMPRGRGAGPKKTTEARGSANTHTHNRVVVHSLSFTLISPHLYTNITTIMPQGANHYLPLSATSYHYLPLVATH